MIYHMSADKPSPIALRIALDQMLTDWVEEDFTCRDPQCLYCSEYPTENDIYFLRQRVTPYNGIRKGGKR